MIPMNLQTPPTAAAPVDPESMRRQMLARALMQQAGGAQVGGMHAAVSPLGEIGTLGAMYGLGRMRQPSMTPDQATSTPTNTGVMRPGPMLA